MIHFANAFELPEFIRDQISKELDDGEQVWWAGVPKHSIGCGYRFIQILMAGIFLGVLWSFALLLFGFFLLDERNLGPLIFAIPVLLFALYLTWWMAKFCFRQFFSKDRSAYVITEKRVIVFHDLFKHNYANTAYTGTGARLHRLQIQSIEGHKIQNIKRSESEDGSGDVMFEFQHKTDPMQRANVHAVNLHSVDNAREVEDMLERLVEQNIDL